MGFEKLITTENLENFVSKEYAEHPLAFFIHIPKTAGTSFRREFEYLLRPSTDVYPNYEVTNPTIREQRPQILQALNERNDFNKLRFVTGHMPYSVAQNLSGRPVAFLTFLREPVARMISDYRYQLSDAHPMKEIARQRWTSLETFVSSRDTSNKMYKFLAKHQREPVEDVISRLKNEFMFVGVIEKYELCFRVVTKAFGLQLKPDIYANRALPNRHAETKIDNSMIEEIRKKNDKDIVIYNHIKSLWDKHEEQLTEALDKPEKSAMLRTLLKARYRWRRFGL